MTDPSAPLSIYLRDRRARIESALEHAWPPPPRSPEVLDEAMRYSLMAGGKRFRPILVLSAAEATASCGRGTVDAATAVELALPAACALELIHTYSLIHDDLPAMDNDTLRRGRPTLHVVYGDGLAVLAGDGLLTEAFALLAREPGGGEPSLVARRLRTLGVIAAAAGATGMVGGQAIDLQAAGQVGGTRAVAAAPLDAESLRRMDGCKTGALIRAAAVAGAIMAGGDDALVAEVEAYAGELGLAFQIVDDILDVEGTRAELGKTPGKDAAAGKPTYPALFGLDESKRLASACLDRALAALGRAGLADSRLADIAKWVVCRAS